MGLFGGVKKVFGKGSLKNLGIDALSGGLWGPITGFTGEGNDLFTQIHQGFANTMTGGAIQQQKATEEAKKARDQAARQYQAQIAAAEATASKIAEDEEERKRRLMLAGTQTPSTLINSYLGLSGPVNTRRGYLG